MAAMAISLPPFFLLFSLAIFALRMIVFALRAKAPFLDGSRRRRLRPIRKGQLSLFSLQSGYSILRRFRRANELSGALSFQIMK